MFASESQTLPSVTDTDSGSVSKDTATLTLLHIIRVDWTSRSRMSIAARQLRSAIDWAGAADRCCVRSVIE